MPPQLPPWQPAVPPPWHQPGASGPWPTAPPPPSARGRNVLIGVVTVFVLITGGFAVVNLTSGGQGGSSTPEANEDLIGVLEVLDPAERDVMMPFVQNLESELSRLAITEDVDLSDVPGFDIQLDGLDVSSTELQPGMAEVDVNGGELSFSTQPDSIPVGEVLQNIIEANGGDTRIEATHDEVNLDEEDLFFVATETDGRWHVSVFFTIAEYARRDEGLDLPTLGQGVQPQGAPSAEDAVRQMVDAATNLDLERMIALLPPDEMRALQTYAPLFLDDAQQSLDEYRTDEGFDIRVDGLELESSAVEGGTRVVPTAGTVTIGTDEGDVAVSLSDNCIEVSGDLATDFEDEFGGTRVCADDLGDLGGDLTPQEEADLRELGQLFGGLRPGLVVVERDGAFYVDPLLSTSDLVFQLFSGIKREDLEEGGVLFRLFTDDMFNDFETCENPDDSYDC